MIPILYEENETSYLSNGLGRLSDLITCTVTEELNGQFVLEMKYPYNGAHVNEITNNRIIYALPGLGRRPQPFKIRDIDKTLADGIKIIARHRCYDTSYYACKEFGQTEYVPYQITPVLYDSDQTTVIGTLTDALSWNVSKSGSTYRLSMIYPKTGTHFTDITTAKYIYAQPGTGLDAVMFDITTANTQASTTTTSNTVTRAKQSGDQAGTVTTSVTDPTTGTVTQTIVRTTISGNTTTIVTTVKVTSYTDLSITATAAVPAPAPHEYNEMTVGTAVTRLGNAAGQLQTCPFSFAVAPSAAGDSWVTAVKEFWSEMPKTARELMGEDSGSIQEVYGGEWEYDDFTCTLYEQRGNANGVEYRYGKNIKDISERINIDELYTHAFSFWKGTASSSTNTELGEYYVKYGTVIKALPSQYDTMFPDQRTLIIDASSEWQDEPTMAQLDAYTRQYIKNNDVGIPTVTIDVSIVDLSASEEYADIRALETVNIGDTVKVVFPRYGVNIDARVTRTVFDPYLEKNNAVTIGKTTARLSDVIAQNKHNIVRSKYDLQKWSDHMAERAIEALAGWYGGSVYKDFSANDHKQAALMFFNTDSRDTATKVLKFDDEGFGFSTGGPDGEYSRMIDTTNPSGATFSDEFAADGNTNGSFIKRGTIRSQSGQGSFWNIENGDIDLYGIFRHLFDGDNVITLALTVNGNATITGTLTGNTINISSGTSSGEFVVSGHHVAAELDQLLQNFQSLSQTLGDLSGSIGGAFQNINDAIRNLNDRVTALEQGA